MQGKNMQLKNKIEQLTTVYCARKQFKKIKIKIKNQNELKWDNKNMHCLRLQSVA